jgi:hypothetical protein
MPEIKPISPTSLLVLILLMPYVLWLLTGTRSDGAKVGIPRIWFYCHKGSGRCGIMAASS